MKKKNFVSLVMGTVGGILFALGMCMCMLPQWNAFTQGVVVSAVGAVVLLAMLCCAPQNGRKSRRPAEWKSCCHGSLGVVGALVLGVGMCMVMV